MSEAEARRFAVESSAILHLPIKYLMIMTALSPRAAKVLVSQPVATQRVAQVRRHLSTSHVSRGEIRDAYILSAARTPTGKVLNRFI